MAVNKDIPSYQELFGSLDFKSGDAGRSVYSPAAYLADLLQLMEDRFRNPDFLIDRRPGVQDILLNGENTFTPLPHMTVVNEILEDRASAGSGDAYERLLNAVYPFEMPFDLQHERVRKFLSFLKITPRTLQHLFARGVDADITARERLGLSEGAYQAVITSQDETGVKASYGLAPDGDLQTLRDVPTFMKATGLGAAEVRELLFQQLSITAIDADGNAEITAAATLFVNEHNGPARLDDAEERIQWGDDASADLPVSWFSNVNRLVRLSRWTGVSLTNLDRALRTCCNRQLDPTAIRRIAVLVDVVEAFDVDFGLVCSLFSDLDTLGIGDDDEAADPFNRILNGRHAALERTYLPSGSPFLPASYVAYELLDLPENVLDPEHKAHRLRLQKALDLSAGDLTEIVTRYQEHAAARGTATVLTGAFGIEALSLLQRVSRLTLMLDLTVSDVLDVLDILESDPTIRLANTFGVLVHEQTETLDAYAMLETGNPTDRFYLVQLLVALGQWINAEDMPAETLKQITLGEADEDLADDADDSQRAAHEARELREIAFLEGLNEGFQEVTLRPGELVSDGGGERAARVVFETVTEPGAGLTWPGHPVLLTFDAERAQQAAHDAIGRLDRISVDDLLGRGLGEPVAERIHAHLVQRGTLDLEGNLIADALPEDSTEFVLATHFCDHRQLVFERVHALYLEAADEVTSADDIELTLHPSDFLDLPLTATAVEELYDNLIFIGVIDSQGTVPDPALFRDPANAARLEVDSGLQLHAEAVHAHLATQLENFDTHPLTVDIGTWAELPLPPDEVKGLLENLEFNGYLDDQGAVQGKTELLALEVDAFDLAIRFYPHRHTILATLQDAVQRFRSGYLTFRIESFAEVADRIAAAEAYAALAEHLVDGRLEAASAARVLADDNILELGGYLGAAGARVVTAAVREILLDAQQYRLTPTALAALEINAEEAAELLDILAESGALNADGRLTLDHVATYSNVNHALVFTIEAFEDFNKEIFFLIHDVAGRLTARRDEITRQLKDLAARQRELVVSTLAEDLELEVDVTTVLFDQVYRLTSQAVGELMAPVLDNIDPLGHITARPEHHSFRLARRRMAQLAALARHLGLDARETAVVFGDQHLVDKFPEQLTLPDGLTHFDALLAGLDNQILLFHGQLVWTYDAQTSELLEEPAQPRPLSELAPELADVASVDAAFVDGDGAGWILAGSTYLKRQPGSERWGPTERLWGEVNSRFDNLERLDAAFVTRDGRTYLLAGDQYVRYQDTYDLIDEGYPRTARPDWRLELGDLPVAEPFEGGVDAAFETSGSTTFLFKGDVFTSSEAPSELLTIGQRLGRVDNPFVDMKRPDAVVSYLGWCWLFLNDDVLVYRDSLESDPVYAAEGNPKPLREAIPGLPDSFCGGLDAGFTGWDERVYLFTDREFVIQTQTQEWVWGQTVSRWGRVRNQLAESGVVDAAFTGLDGKVYLFSGDQYVRYSGVNFRRVDEGYPRSVAPDWGGLSRVDAAFVLDGKTYLFGTNAQGVGEYLRFSTRDYSTADEGYPLPTDDNWWNLPAALVEAGFASPDAVFVGVDGSSYLFAGHRYIRYDRNRRWWSEPSEISQGWDSLPFSAITAGFTGKDGRTYLFSVVPVGTSLALSSLGDMPAPGEGIFVRYSDPDYNKLDDTYPRAVRGSWGRVRNNLQRTGRVDAALTLRSMVEEDVDGETQEVEALHMYLFSGDQFYRYTGAATDQYVDEGYPLQLRTSLHLEPRFTELEPGSVTRLDAVFADRRNLYLFQDDSILVLLSEAYRSYDLQTDAAGIRAACLEDGALYFEDTSGWHHLSYPELRNRSVTPGRPRALRRAAEEFQNGLSAILYGTDRNTYLFKDNQCFDTVLQRSYPTAEAWGRVRNTLVEQNRVDAALTGQDGKVYLFSGEQFVVYTIDEEDATRAISEHIDDLPKGIAEHWGGLNNVRHAYVLGGKTYLVEAPDEDGTLRYVTYSGNNYTEADGTPQQAGFEFWQVPTEIVAEGFDRVDAVLVEEPNLFLFRGRNFIQHDVERDIWTPPRPVEQVWRKLPNVHPHFEDIHTAFTAPDGTTWFFSHETYALYQDGAFSADPPRRIDERWGIVDNRIALTGRVDAAVVVGEATFLFSGDQYVRYSGSDYRTVDAGYPRAVAGRLREEPAFAALPESFETVLEPFADDDAAGITAAFVDTGSIYLIVGDVLHAASSELTRRRPLSSLGHIRNELARRGRIDAAFVGPSGAAYLLSGDQYARYEDMSQEYVDPGYPRAIGDLLTEVLPGVTGVSLPDDFQHNLDAAFPGTDGSFYAFKDEDYLRVTADGGVATLERQPIRPTWGRAATPFAPPSEDQNTVLDAAFVGPDRALYIFKGPWFARYGDPAAKHVDPGYPLSIRDNWGDLPVEFEEGIHGGFVLDRRTYLTRDDLYVRFEDPTYRRMDAIYAQTFTRRWGKWNAIHLADILLVQRYRSLARKSQSGEGSLTNFLHDENRVPYELLSEVFGFDINDVQWLKRHDGFLQRVVSESPEAAFQIELVLRIYDILSVTTRMGSYPQEVYEQVWRPLYGDGGGATTGVADTLYRFLGNRNTGEDWQILQRQVDDEVATLRRDALVAYVVAHDDRVGNVRELNERLLIDVMMESCAETSRVKEAAAAVQLYFHRYLVNLEILDPEGTADGVARNQIREQWQWMKNYRVWEANRKVFLYPENFIRPELRDTKTPAFQTLEDELLQGEITDISAQRVYKTYLDEYTEVSRLAISGGYVYDDPESRHDKELVLFGHTRTDPRTHYYRTAAFSQGQTQSVVWQPWLSVGVEIDANKVDPVFAFGRVFVFWAEVETQVVESDSTVIKTEDVDGGQRVSNDAGFEYHIRIRFSFYNLNQEWTQPQLLRAEIKETSFITGVQLHVENAARIEANNHENILVGCTYAVRIAPGTPDVAQSCFFSLSDDFVTRSADSPPIAAPPDELINRLFSAAEAAEIRARGNVITLNTTQQSSEGPWFSFDHKGGSFLCKPSEPSLGPDNILQPLAEHNGEFPEWSRIDAAVEVPGTGPETGSVFFDNHDVNGEGGQYAVRQQVDGPFEIATTSLRWGHVFNLVARDSAVDAALFRNNILYLFRGSQYLEYSADSSLNWADRDGVKSLDGNNDGFPQQGPIQAAVEGRFGSTYFFLGDGTFVQGGEPGNPMAINRHWGRAPNTFTNPDNAKPVTGGFVHGEHTYLIGGQVVRYTGAAYDLCDEDYPKRRTLFEVLDDLGCTNNDDAFKPVGVTAAYKENGVIALFGNDGKLYRFQDSLVADPVPGPEPWANLAFDDVVVAFVGERLEVEGGEPEELGRRIHAAFIGRDGRVYLFSDQEYRTFPAAGLTVQTLVALIRVWDGKAVADHWGIESNVFTRANHVDAACRIGPNTFLFSGASYIRYSDDNYHNMDQGYPQPLAGNPDGLPEWTHVDAAFSTGRQTVFFRDQVFAWLDNVATTQPVYPRWGRVMTNVVERGVDAAWTHDSRLYLISGNQLLRYSLGAAGAGRLCDRGYPKTYRQYGTFLWWRGKTVSAAFTLQDRVYLFAGNVYARLDEGQEPGQELTYQPIRGNWGNLHPEFMSGIDAALVTRDPNRLVLFKDGEYIRYVLDDPQEAQPYELETAQFDLIRLTTSTASQLNQRLFGGGLDRLLSLETQEIDETPTFSSAVGANAPTTIRVTDQIPNPPISSHLDFHSANGIYYWEIFFHAPFLIAQALNTEQKFDEAKSWYEHIFDPTEKAEYWKFLPFLTIDLMGLVASSEDKLAQLASLVANDDSVRPLVAAIVERFNELNTLLTPLQDVFLGLRSLSPDEVEAQLVALPPIIEGSAGEPGLQPQLEALPDTVDGLTGEQEAELRELKRRLLELIAIVLRLPGTYRAQFNSEAQLAAYLDDPFDPHAIAALREIAYRKAVVMRYVDNLLDWGDMLFGQYTLESIQEARMLYMLGYDLLGRRPEGLGTLALADDTSYQELENIDQDYEFLLYLENTLDPPSTPPVSAPLPHDAMVDSAYFYIPENEQFLDYWDRVEDRLYKIRNCLNIFGVEQPLPLFQPPIDPAALVLAASGGGGAAAALASLGAATPHYRFSFLIAKAQGLVQRLSQLGNELLAALEKKDGEELSQLQAEQEAEIMTLMVGVREAQLDEAAATRDSLIEARKQAEQRLQRYDDWIESGFSGWEIAQMSVMGGAVIAHAVSAIARAVAAVGGAAPDALVGPFIAGVKIGGSNASNVATSVAEVAEAVGEGLSVGGEILGIVGQHERMKDEWTLQSDLATIDIQQIEAQIVGAEAQIRAVEQEIAVAEKEVEHKRALSTFYTSKFTNQQLYQWLAGQLSGVYFQTYRLAHDMAKSAERAFQFERGFPESETSFVQGHYWNSQRKGLTAGDRLALDLDRMEQAFVETDQRRLEIGRDISLLDLDPLAFLQLKARGVCEFHLTEALYDFDFPGHYQRQLKTIAITFDVPEGVFVNATLTQLSDRTVMKPDPKAVKYLLGPKDEPPTTIRSNWKARQQVALSRHDEFELNNGLFELRFDSERYLPFEGTGAVSSWRLELNGSPNAFDVSDLLEVTLNVKYTASQGGSAFAEAVRGMLKPYTAWRFFDMNFDFGETWKNFLAGDSDELVLRFTQNLFPNLASSKIASIYSTFDTVGDDTVKVLLNGQEDLALRDGGSLDTTGLRVSAKGSDLLFKVVGDKSNLRNLQMVMSYKANVG